MKAQVVDLEGVPGPTFPAINDKIVEEIDNRPRGARTALADALAVPPATVSHWYHRHQSPEPTRAISSTRCPLPPQVQPSGRTYVPPVTVTSV